MTTFINFMNSCYTEVTVIKSRRMRWTDSDYAEKEDTIKKFDEKSELGN